MMAASSRQERWIAVLLVVCVCLVAFWEITSRLASRPFDKLRLGPEDFAGFQPADPQWSIRLVHVKGTPSEPTVIAYEMRRRQTAPEPGAVTNTNAIGHPLLVRLVHGYNMVDCMRIKQYRVELLKDGRQTPPGTMQIDGLPPEPVLPVQVWRLTSAGGECSVWVTSMLRATDFAATDTDTRDMAFPRVGTPDDPSWAPSGLKWSSFRHPIRNFSLYLRSKWNASRSDWLTFLRLRQPAWASDVMLTMVSEYHGPSVTDDSEAAVSAYVQEAHRLLYRCLKAHGGPASRQAAAGAITPAAGD